MSDKSIKQLEAEIKAAEAERLRLLLSISSNKCEWCGCYEGIHKSNCLFIIKYCS